VQMGPTGVLLPAPSGAGKSTTVAGLVHAGFEYLSDELVALDVSAQRLLHPFPKPLTLKPGSFDVVRAMDPGLDPAGHPESSGYVGYEWNIPPDRIRKGSVGSLCLPAVVVVPQFVAGARTALTPLAADDAFLALALNTVNLDTLGGRGAVLVHDLVERCDCYTLEIGDLSTACRLMLELVGDGGVQSNAEMEPEHVRGG
jgi:hypothetical protein